MPPDDKDDFDIFLAQLTMFADRGYWQCDEKTPDHEAHRAQSAALELLDALEAADYISRADADGDVCTAMRNLLDSGEWTDTDYAYAARPGVTDSECGHEWYAYDLKRNPKLRSDDPELEKSRQLWAAK
jgi:hypothetical protein